MVHADGTNIAVMSEEVPPPSSPSVDAPDEPGELLESPGGDASAGDGSEMAIEQPEVLAAAVAGTQPENVIESPAKIIRMGSMVKQLLEEVRQAPMDDTARDHLRRIYRQSVDELKSALSPDLAEELERLAPDFDSTEPPSEASLRIAQAQLVGWLEGLFHGIQATLVAQQMSQRSQLDQLRGQLPVPPDASSGPMRGPAGYL